MADTVGRAVLELALDPTPFSEGLKNAGGEAKNFSKAFDGVGSSGSKASGEIVTGLKRISDTLGPLGRAIGVTFSVGAVIGFSKQVLDFTGHMNDLSAQTGIGVERIQALNFVAAGAGVTIDQITDAVDQMAHRVAGGDASAVGALERLHLSIYELRQLTPDQVFIRVGEAIAGIKDPAERVRLEMDLFGKSGATMGRLFTENLGQIVAEAQKDGPIIDKELIDRADEFGDFWQQAWIRFQAYSVKAVASTGGLITKLFANAQGDAAAGVDPAKIGVETDRLLADLQKRVPKLEIPAQLSIVGPTQQEIAALDAQSAKLAESAKAAIEANKQHDAFVATVDRASIGVRTWVVNFQAVPSLIHDAGDEIAALRDQLPGAETGFDALVEHGNHVQEVNQKLAEMGAMLPGIGVVSQNVSAQVSSGWDVARDHVGTALQLLTDDLSKMGNIGGGVLSDLTRGVGTMIASLKTAKDSVSALKTGFGDLTGGGGLSSILGGLAGIASGIGGIVAVASAAVSGIKALFGAFQSDETKYVNKPRDQFFAQFGGYDGLASALTKAFEDQGIDDAGNKAHSLITTLEDADNADKFHSAEDAIANIFKGVGRDIQTFARGGIATGVRPIAGIFGEAGPEALLPIDRITDLLPGASSAAATAMRDGLAKLDTRMATMERHQRDLPFILTTALKGALVLA